MSSNPERPVLFGDTLPAFILDEGLPKTREMVEKHIDPLLKLLPTSYKLLAKGMLRSPELTARYVKHLANAEQLKQEHSSENIFGTALFELGKELLQDYGVGKLLGPHVLAARSAVRGIGIAIGVPDLEKEIICGVGNGFYEGSQAIQMNKWEDDRVLREAVHILWSSAGTLATDLLDTDFPKTYYGENITRGLVENLAWQHAWHLQKE